METRPTKRRRFVSCVFYLNRPKITNVSKRNNIYEHIIYFLLFMVESKISFFFLGMNSNKKGKVYFIWLIKILQNSYRLLLYIFDWDFNFL